MNMVEAAEVLHKRLYPHGPGFDEERFKETVLSSEERERMKADEDRIRAIYGRLGSIGLGIGSCE